MLAVEGLVVITVAAFVAGRPWADRYCVTLTVFNTLGQRVATLVNEIQGAGFHDVSFDASGLASEPRFHPARRQIGGWGLALLI